MNGNAADWQRQPGQGRYARPERERRFLVQGDPPAGISSRHIEDRYIEGTRLRLRRVSDGTNDVYKLTQKIRVSEGDPADVRITNAYLSRGEYELLTCLPAATISKSRTAHRVGSRDLAVDLFKHRLDGLRLAELEVASLDEPVELPAWVGREVTHDDRYSGGSLAFASDEDVRLLLDRSLH